VLPMTKALTRVLSVRLSASPPLHLYVIFRPRVHLDFIRQYPPAESPALPPNPSPTVLSVSHRKPDSPDPPAIVIVTVTVPVIVTPIPNSSLTHTHLISPRANEPGT
jgi:hypothetical protein